VGSGTPRAAAASMYCAVLRMVIAMSRSAMGGGQAAYEIHDEQAAVVQQIFEWVGRDRISIGEVSRRLKAQAIPSATGKSWWDRTSIWAILKNPAYMGCAAFGKTRTGPRRPRLRTQRASSTTPRRTCSTYDTEPTEQIPIPVPRSSPNRCLRQCKNS